MELRCLKWAHKTHLDIQHTSYGQKKGWESNCQFDFQPLKVENHLDFLARRWCATSVGNILMRAITLLMISFLSEVCTQNYGPPKSYDCQVWEFWGVGSLGQNDVWVLVLWACTKYTLKGKVVVSPKSGLWWVLWVWVCP